MSAEAVSPEAEGTVSVVTPRALDWRAAAVLAALIAVAYVNSFRGVFVLDDFFSITSNPTIRHLSWTALQPPGGSGITVEARPILNFSFALNYAISGAE